MREHHDIQSPPLRPEIVKELEQFPAEVLRFVLMILQARQTQEQK